jgi:hypothetical protein
VKKESINSEYESGQCVVGPGPAHPWRPPMAHTVVSAFWLLASYASIQAQRLSFVWLSAVSIAALAILSFNARNVITRVVLINLGAAVMAFGLCELYLWNTTPEKTNTYCCNDAYMIRDDHFGMVPRKHYSAAHVKTINSVPIYNVTYTIDENGLRVAPPYDERTVLGSVLFFGCSFTIGEGVADNEAMPYVTGLLSHGRYAIYNFGFHGYGTQHMLAALESKSVNAIVSVPPKYIIYQAIPYHLQRISGLVSWFPHAPRYRQTDNGRVVPQGNFDTVTDETRYSRIERLWRASGFIGDAVSTTLRKSFVYNKLVSPFRSLSEEDVKLFLAIVDQARNAAKLQYPESEFHVILWDNMFRQRDFLRFLPLVLNGLQTQKIRVHLLSNIIPDYDGSVPDTRYELHIRDSHPNPFTHHLLATYVAKEILHID